MTQHTPVPWTFDSRDLRNDGMTIHAPDGVIAKIPLLGAYPSKEELANGAFIVRACNAHAEMLAALRELENANDLAMVRDFKRTIRAAIAKAEKQ
jgi:hypothetical protein